MCITVIPFSFFFFSHFHSFSTRSDYRGYSWCAAFYDPCAQRRTFLFQRSGREERRAGATEAGGDKNDSNAKTKRESLKQYLEKQ